VTRDLDLSTFDLKINGFPGLIVKHFYVKFGDSIFLGFRDIAQKNRKTRLQSAWVNKKEK